MVYHLYLIRHGKTQSNLERRYSGVSDEPLHVVGSRELAEKIRAGTYPKVEKVYVSPMKRCRQTAELIYPHLPEEAIPGFTEYNFGDFEGKSYQELKDKLSYQEWIRSAGTSRPPGGDDIQIYKQRNCQAFEQVMEKIIQENWREAALIVHGGTIMAILEKYGPGDKGFYGWQVPNCEGYQLVIREELWKRERVIKHFEEM